MKKILPLLLLLVVLFPCALFAQSNFKPGYILKTNGDTVKGYINYREWNLSPKKIEFKSSPNDNNITSYQPSQIKAFGITDIDKYISYIGRVSVDDNTFPDLPAKLDTTTRTDTLFLQLIYQGTPLSLLVQRDAQKFRFFVKENETHPVELKYHQYYADARQVTSISPYTGLLNRLANKYNPSSGIHTTIEHSRFSSTSLANVIKQINNDDNKISPGSAGTVGSRFFAGVALNRTTTEFSAENPFSEVPSSSYTPRINVGFDFFPNKYTQRLFFRTELGFSAINPSFKKAGPAVVYGYSFKQYTISLTPQLIYNLYNKDNFKAYLGAGVVLNNSINTNGSRTIEIYGTPNNSTTNYELKSFWLGYQLQAGVIVNRRINIYASYSPAITQYTNYVLFEIKNTSYSVGINYLFGK